MRPGKITQHWKMVLAVLLLTGTWPGLAGADGPGGQPDKLPLAAGFCVNRVNTFLQKNEPGRAVEILKAFQAKAGGMDAQKAAARGYTHYYMDFLLGNCLMMMDGKTADDSLVRQAADAYGRAVEKRPGLSAAWLNLAQCRYRLDQKVAAAEAFERGYDTALEKKPDHLYYASACYFFSERYAEALAVFDRLTAHHRDAVKPDWKEIPANALLSLNRNRDALPWLEELARLSRGKKKEQWQEVLLYQYLTLKMSQKALEYARFLTRTGPANPRWWKALTHIHLDRQELEKGLQSLMIYGFLTPLTPSETTLLADLFLSCNIPREAARCYEAWIDMSQEGTDSVSGKRREDLREKILRICDAYRQAGQVEKAIFWADRGLDLVREPKLLFLKADLLYREKRYGQAYNAYERLAGYTSHRGVGALMMGYAAWSHGDMDAASRAFERAVAFPKQKEAALSALDQIRKAAPDKGGPSH